MSTFYKIQTFPQSRLATFDVFSVGKRKHHVAAILEFDVTEARIKLKALKRSEKNVSFSAWLLKTISAAIAMHPEVAAFRIGKRKIISFNDINISFLVEKEIEGKKVPFPLVIEKVNQKTIPEITREIHDSKNLALSKDDIVINRKPRFSERLYYRMPGFMRRLTWRIMLNNPKFVFGKMGNVSVTSPGMMGRVNGWFIHNSVHPVSFGIGSVLKKPVVINDKIEIREILNATLLLDHDVVDGAPMARFVKDMTRYIEKGEEIQ